MEMDRTVNVDSKEQLQVEETLDCCRLEFSEAVPFTRGTDDSCRTGFMETVPVTIDTDGLCTTEYISGDWSAKVELQNLAVPDDVRWIISVILCML